MRKREGKEGGGREREGGKREGRREKEREGGRGGGRERGRERGRGGREGGREGGRGRAHKLQVAQKYHQHGVIQLSMYCTSHLNASFFGRLLNQSSTPSHTSTHHHSTRHSVQNLHITSTNTAFRGLTIATVHKELVADWAMYYRHAQTWYMYIHCTYLYALQGVDHGGSNIWTLGKRCQCQ